LKLVQRLTNTWMVHWVSHSSMAKAPICRTWFCLTAQKGSGWSWSVGSRASCITDVLNRRLWWWDEGCDVCKQEHAWKSEGTHAVYEQKDVHGVSDGLFHKPVSCDMVELFGLDVLDFAGCKDDLHL
jgi:hypothetical protein